MGSVGFVALCAGLCVLLLNVQTVRAGSLRSDNADVAAVLVQLSRTVVALEAKFTSQEAKFASQEATITSQGATITSQGAKITSQEATITSQGDKITSQGAKITSQETAITSQGDKITSQGVKITSQEAAITSQGDKITSQGAKITSQEAIITSQGAKITSQGAKITSQEARIAQLEVENNKKVAFSVYISTGGRPVPSTTGSIVPFAGTTTNVGHAFNTATSVFTCPFPGDYFFALSLDVSKDYENMSLHKNGVSVARADKDDSVSTHLTANAVLSLKAGDVVTVVHNHSVGRVDDGDDSIFTGFLVK